jgi:hypothetical protein
MQLVRLQDATRQSLARRAGDPHGGNGTFYELLTGREGAPDNHSLQLVELTSGSAMARHRHNFEQVRVMLEGSYGYGPGLVQQQGQVGYFCEGTHCTHDTAQRSLALLLQVGGPSGAGYVSRRQLTEGVAALRGKGEFHDSSFTWYDAQGIKRSKNCYEAVWEHIHGRPIHYPRPQYAAPVLMDPERFAWVAMPGREGVWLRTLGRFNDGGLALTQLRLAAGAELVLPRGRQVLLLCCAQGGGQVETRPYERMSALRVEIGESPLLRASRESIFFGFELPRFA